MSYMVGHGAQLTRCDVARRTSIAPTGVRHSSVMRRSAFLVAAFAAACSLAFAAAIGSDMARRQAYTTGVCIALFTAEAHGTIDDPGRKRIIHSLTSVANPFADRFAIGRSEMLRACEDLRAASAR